MVNVIEAGFYVSLQEPGGPAPFPLDLFQRAVATARAAETLTAILEVWSVGAVVHGFENESHGLLYDFISGTWDAEFPHLPITFRDEHSSDGIWLVLLSSHLFDELPDFVHSKAIDGFLVCAWGHIPGLRLDPLVSQDVEFRLE